MCIYQSPKIKDQKVSTTTYQHCRSQIKFVEELRDEYVYFQHIGYILLLHIAEHIDEPFEVLVRGTDPQEVHLLTGYARVAIGAGPKDQVVENGRVRGHPDATAHHDGHFELVPVLIAAPEGSFDAELGLVLRVVVAWIEIVPQLPGPRSLGLNVAAEEVLVRGGGQRETVHLAGPEGGARQTHPLARQVLQVRRSVKLDLDHIRGQ